MEDAVTPTLSAPSDIEKTLIALWESMKTAHKTRACLFNLIIFTGDAERIQYFKNIASKVINLFPLRLILVIANPQETKDELQVKVSIVSPERSHGFIACDFIEIEATGGALKRLPSVVIPHLIPDLPVYFLWGEDPCHHDKVCHELEKFATRIIFDSESCDDLSVFSSSLLDHFQKGHADIADLNWARIESWREIIANIFASKDKQTMLPCLSQVVITYNSAASPFFKKTKIQALFLQGWISVQLGWKISKFTDHEGTITLEYTRGKDIIQVLLIPKQETSLWAGTILSLELNTSDSRKFLLERDLKRPQEMSLYYSSLKECYLPLHFLFTKTDSGQSLVKEICHVGTSPHYIQVLGYLHELHQHINCQ